MVTSHIIPMSLLPTVSNGGVWLDYRIGEAFNRVCVYRISDFSVVCRGRCPYEWHRGVWTVSEGCELFRIPRHIRESHTLSQFSLPPLSCWNVRDSGDGLEGFPTPGRNFILYGESGLENGKVQHQQGPARAYPSAKGVTTHTHTHTHIDPAHLQ
jgi:hypothetical protein